MNISPKYRHPLDEIHNLDWKQPYEIDIYFDLEKAKEGYAQAQFNIGILYSSNIYIPINYGEAFIWYLKAARKGHAKSQNNIGIMLWEGLGTFQNYDESVEWFYESSRQKCEEGIFNLKQIHHNKKKFKWCMETEYYTMIPL